MKEQIQKKKSNMKYWIMTAALIILIVIFLVANGRDPNKVSQDNVNKITETETKSVPVPSPIQDISNYTSSTIASAQKMISFTMGMMGVTLFVFIAYKMFSVFRGGGIWE